MLPTIERHLLTSMSSVMSQTLSSRTDAPKELQATGVSEHLHLHRCMDVNASVLHPTFTYSRLEDDREYQAGGIPWQSLCERLLQYGSKQFTLPVII